MAHHPAAPGPIGLVPHEALEKPWIRMIFSVIFGIIRRTIYRHRFQGLPPFFVIGVENPRPAFRDDYRIIVARDNNPTGAKAHPHRTKICPCRIFFFGPSH